MSRRPTFTERRRVRFALRVASLEAMEERNMITESLGIMTLGIGVPTAMRTLGARTEAGAAAAIVRPAPRARRSALTSFASGRRASALEGGWSKDKALPPVAARLATAPAGNDWLTLSRKSPSAAQAAGPLSTPRVVKPPSAPAGQTASRGGSGGAVAPKIAALRLPAPSGGDNSGSATGALGSSLALSGASGATHAGTTARQSTAPTAGSGAATAASTALVAPAPTNGIRQPIDPRIDSVHGNSSSAALLSFSYFPLYTLDYNDGAVFFPGTTQLATPYGYVDLRAQVRDAAVASYSWDTSHLTDANNITGASTYRLQFQWLGAISPATTSSATLTVTDTNGHQEVQTYTFQVPTQVYGSGTANGAWPESLAPNTVLSAAPSFASHNVSVDANSGASDTLIPLPAYNPNILGLALTYDSLVADARPIVVEHHTLDPALAIPTKVSGQLTFNGTAGAAYYYDTSQFIPGDVQQIALQADATALSTGRYSYTVTVGDVRGSTTTTTASGAATVLNGSGNAFGAGWTLQGLEHATSASGGVILDLGMGGRSLWFSGGGPYTSPAGDFSTLAAVSGGGYTRTLTDGTVYNFNSSGYETSVADRNGLATSFAYSGGNLSTVTDPYGKVTNFAYSGGALSTITDPASRVATFTHSGTNLTGVTLPDGNAWSYGYDGSHRLTGVTDPRSKTVTVAYDSAERASTITRPDSTVEAFTAYQERGWTNSGTSGSPAAATLLAEARSTYTDPLGNVTDLRPDWNGQGLTGQAADASGNVTTYDRDANGLATIAVDRLNRISQYAYDSHGNVTTLTYADGNKDQYTYNGFAEPTTHTDANNHTTSYTYDGNGNLTVVQDPLNNRTTMTYTGDGVVATVNDARHNVTSYQYDSQDRLTTITNPDSSTKRIAYDGKGNPATVTDERGNATTSSYDALNRVTGTTDALGNATSYSYDASGNQAVVQAPLARTTTYAYDSMDRITTVTDPLAHSTVIGYDSGGNMLTVTDPLSRVTTFAYDAEDRRTVATDPLGNATTTAYDAEGQVLTVTDPLNRVTTTTYNNRGWKATSTDPLGNLSTYTYSATGKPASVADQRSLGQVFINYTYDNDDRLTAVNNSNITTTTYGYDAVGNRTTITDGNNNTTTNTYDSRNRPTTVTDPLTHATVIGYDPAGNKTTLTDALGQTTTTQYDALNRATTITDARSAQTVLSYDAAGRNTALMDPNGNRTTFAYDALDRKTTMTDPLGHSATYSYDADGELTDRTDRNGRRTTYAYDSGGRQTGETWVGSSPSETITYADDADGETTGAADANARLTFTYDSGGRQLTASTSGTAGQPSVTLTSGYDAHGNRTSLADNLSSAGLTTYSYDLANRLSTIARSLGGASGPQVVFGYDSGNRLTSESRTIGGSGAQVNTTFAYDAANRLTTITDGKAVQNFFPPGWIVTSLATYAYGYDNANRVTSEQNAEGTVTYGYDAANELTGTLGSRAETYTYDSGGNRTMTGYTTGTGNDLSASPGYTYTYDNEGNQITKTDTSSHVVTSYSYDYHNRLTAVSVGGTLVASYTYDPLDRRIGFNDNGTQTWVVWNGQNPYADFNGSGTLQDRYLYGLAVDQLLARTDSGGATAWYLADKLGTVRDIANSLGTVIDHLSYDSYGSPLSESSPANGDRFKFTGREYDAAAGLYDYRARVYLAAAGRFATQDPKGFAAGDANLYRYVRDEPTNATDPSGRDALGLPLDTSMVQMAGAMAAAASAAAASAGEAIAATAASAAALITAPVVAGVGSVVVIGWASWDIMSSHAAQAAAEASSQAIDLKIQMIALTAGMAANAALAKSYQELSEAYQNAILHYASALMYYNMMQNDNPDDPNLGKYHREVLIAAAMMKAAYDAFRKQFPGSFN